MRLRAVLAGAWSCATLERSEAALERPLLSLPAMPTAYRLRKLPSAEQVRCVVRELGASGDIPRGGDELDQTVVLAQMQGEAPLPFAQRVLDRIASLERTGRHFEAALVTTGDLDDHPTRAARSRIVLGLAAHARAHGGISELRLSAPADAGPPRRAELLGLVEEVWALGGERPIPIRVSFDDSAPAEEQSGIFAVPARARS